MRSKSISLLLPLSAMALVSSPAAAAITNNNNEDINSNRRIKVPLHRRLVDAISETTTMSMPSSSLQHNIRRFEIEVELDGPNGGPATTSSLFVDEVEEMAITSKTTYSFPKHREFRADHIQNVAILASHGSNGASASGGLTIISVNKASGNVRGIQHGGGGVKRISHDSTNNDDDKLRLERMTSSEDHERRLREQMANWTCGAEIATDYHHDEEDDRHYYQRHYSRSLQHHDEFQNSTNILYENVKTARSSVNDPATSTWIPPTKYSFHIPLYIEVDSTFVNRQGSLNEAIEYVNFLTSAVNVIIEHELDAHLEVVHVEETDIYDNITNTQDALRMQRLRPRDNLAGSNYYDSDDKIILVHALLGRHVGGGIAYIDTICDRKWSFGITSDVKGSFTTLEKESLLDLFYYAHELGHSLGSDHTYDGYEPAVDTCGSLCTLGDEFKSDPAGLPLDNSATLMSYCNFCSGGMDNIAFTYGGLWNGISPRSDIDNWINHPDIAGLGSVSVEPKRVSYTIWNLLSEKVKECVEPPSQSQGTQGCNDSSDCDDNNMCTIDVCSPGNVCVVTNTLGSCCGNGVCEQGEISAICSDCGPYVIKPSKVCDDCHALDGFVLEVGVSENANQAVLLKSISLLHKKPELAGSYVELFIARSYNTGEATKLDSGLWQGVTAQYVPSKSGMMEITLPSPILVDIAGKVEIYIAASEELLQFGVGAYSIENDHGVQLNSSRAVSGRFGTSLQSFSLNCEIKYVVEEVTSSLPMYIEEFRNGRGGSELVIESSAADTNNEMQSAVNIWNDEVSGAVVQASITLYSASVAILLVLFHKL